MAKNDLLFTLCSAEDVFPVPDEVLNVDDHSSVFLLVNAQLSLQFIGLPSLLLLLLTLLLILLLLLMLLFLLLLLLLLPLSLLLIIINVIIFVVIVIIVTIIIIVVNVMECSAYKDLFRVLLWFWCGTFELMLSCCLVSISC